MKRIIYKEIDGYKVIDGIEEMYIDAEATKAEIRKIYPEMKLFSKELILKHAIYFGTNVPFEYKIVKDDEARELFIKFEAAANKSCKLSAALEEIDDNRNVVTWKKTGDNWKKNVIVKLEEKINPSEIKESDLTVEQQEEINIQLNKERIDALSDEDRQKEKEMMIEAILNQSINMRSGLEIQGVPAADALLQAQTWYNTEVIKVEELYKKKIKEVKVKNGQRY
jgi:hypothetical protein